MTTATYRFHERIAMRRDADDDTEFPAMVEELLLAILDAPQPGLTTRERSGMSGFCPGSGKPPASRFENKQLPSGKVIATRGTCSECGAEMALSKQQSRQPVIRKHPARLS